LGRWKLGWELIIGKITSTSNWKMNVVFLIINSQSIFRCSDFIFHFMLNEHLPLIVPSVDGVKVFLLPVAFFFYISRVLENEMGGISGQFWCLIVSSCRALKTLQSWHLFRFVTVVELLYLLIEYFPWNCLLLPIFEFIINGSSVRFELICIFFL